VQLTDREGRFRFTTIKPGPYRILRQVPRNRERLIAELLPAPPGEDASSRLVRWDIVSPRG
jgi:hypothetical protein